MPAHTGSLVRQHRPVEFTDAKRRPMRSTRGRHFFFFRSTDEQLRTILDTCGQYSFSKAQKWSFAPTDAESRPMRLVVARNDTCFPTRLTMRFGHFATRVHYTFEQYNWPMFCVSRFDRPVCTSIHVMRIGDASRRLIRDICAFYSKYLYLPTQVLVYLQPVRIVVQFYRPDGQGTNSGNAARPIVLADVRRWAMQLAGKSRHTPHTRAT